MKAVPLELKAANAFVAANHRHHAPVVRDKWRFGVVDDSGKLIGVLHAAKPIARLLDDGKTIEIVRCCSDGTKNLCSFMLGRARRIAKAMGYSKMISYILSTECGVSYKAAGWHKEADKEPDEQGRRGFRNAHVSSAFRCAVFARVLCGRKFRTRGHTWNTPGRPRTTTAPICDKQRWALILDPSGDDGGGAP